MDKAMLALRRGLTGRWCRRQDWGRWRAAAPTSLRRGTAPAPPVTRGLASYQNARHELQAAVRALQAQHDVARHASRYDELRQKANELEGALSEDPDIWTLRPKKAHRAMRELAQLQGRLGKVDRLAQSCNDAEAYAGLVLESMEHGHAHADPDALEDCMAEIRAVRADLVAFVDHTLVDPTTADAHDCLLVIEAGNGGLDAKDWVDMLRGMYGAWAARRGFALEEVSVVPDKVAGLRSCILELKASPAPADADNPAAHCPYGWARTEAGVHKLVRFSPFDKAHRRHTSHARVAVVPVEDDRDSGGGARADFPLDKKDLRVDRFRSSGPGGQHANTTDSAVRITHLPTGAVATAQDSRSQHDNLATATARLRNELWAREQRRRMEEAQRFRHPGGGGGEVGGGGGGSDAAGAVDAGAGGWGEHIRQYVLNPQPYVKDQRTNMAVDGSHAVEEVLKGGDIDAFIKGALMRARETVEAAAAATTTAKGSGSGDGAAAARRR